jgi:hypothetical protein
LTESGGINEVQDLLIPDLGEKKVIRTRINDKLSYLEAHGESLDLCVPSPEFQQGWIRLMNKLQKVHAKEARKSIRKRNEVNRYSPPPPLEPQHKKLRQKKTAKKRNAEAVSTAPLDEVAMANLIGKVVAEAIDARLPVVTQSQSSTDHRSRIPDLRRPSRSPDRRSRSRERRHRASRSPERSPERNPRGPERSQRGHERYRSRSPQRQRHPTPCADHGHAQYNMQPTHTPENIIGGFLFSLFNQAGSASSSYRSRYTGISPHPGHCITCSQYRERCTCHHQFY